MHWDRAIRSRVSGFPYTVVFSLMQPRTLLQLILLAAAAAAAVLLRMMTATMRACRCVVPPQVTAAVVGMNEFDPTIFSVLRSLDRPDLVSHHQVRSIAAFGLAILDAALV